MTNRLLILDLDETLIHGTETPLTSEADFVVCNQFHIYRRTNLSEFLSYCFDHFRIAVWTSSSQDYASEVVRNIFPRPEELEFLWTRKRCTRKWNPDTGDFYWVKDLKKVKRMGYDLRHVLMVDNSPQKLERHYGNLIHITPFEGEPDDELLFLARYLEILRTEVNVRILEKRKWRQRILINPG